MNNNNKYIKKKNNLNDKKICSILLSHSRLQVELLCFGKHAIPAAVIFVCKDIGT